ncbi:hypothetical protein ANN_23546 [Periplaneta americana]|uniref:Uncharacterized protein n=1 Tax=Periplaneta americana TaxID=6978 RepID=A0ABQ8SMA9_PERAM|nr:hypothetical protein ANN_23546 [Periplaneta americana]
MQVKAICVRLDRFCRYIYRMGRAPLTKPFIDFMMASKTFYNTLLIWAQFLGGDCSDNLTSSSAIVLVMVMVFLMVTDDGGDGSESPVQQNSYNGWGDHRVNHTIPPFWLDDRPPLLRQVKVRPAAGWSDLALQGCSAMDLLFFIIQGSLVVAFSADTDDYCALNCGIPGQTSHSAECAPNIMAVDIGHIRQHICLTWSQATKGNIEGGGFGPVLWIEFGVAQWSERLVRRTKDPASAGTTLYHSCSLRFKSQDKRQCHAQLWLHTAVNTSNIGRPCSPSALYRLTQLV